jgi:hypothetical protein
MGDNCLSLFRYCQRLYPIHPKAMGSFYCQHDDYSLQACFLHRGVCDDSCFNSHRGFDAETDNDYDYANEYYDYDNEHN